MNSTWILVLFGTIFLAAETSATSKRCTIWLLEKTKACKLSCKVLGHETGVCDPSDTCICSETDYDFFADVKEWVEEKLDLDMLKEKVKTKYNSFKEEVSELSDDVKKWLPSRCKIGSSFCNDFCQSVGKYDGKCNDDNTDCECNDEFVSPKEYGLCASESICRLDCQANGKATGYCGGPKGWTCECSSRSDVKDGSRDREVEEIDIRNPEFNPDFAFEAR